MALPHHSGSVLNQPTSGKRDGFWSWLWMWLTTVDHKKIGIMYITSGAFFFLLGGIEALLIRIQLIKPNADIIGADLFNQLFTMHGTTMIFLVAMPILIGLMNCIMPLQIGARDVAFPSMNALSLWLFNIGAIILNLSWFLGGAPNAGWFAYAPLTNDGVNAALGIDFYHIGLQISGFGTLMGAINFMVTVINMRAPGMSLLRMPMFTWTTILTSVMILFAFPPLTVNFFLLMFDRIFDANFFNVGQGGNVMIWQHLFWIFGHPEVYIVILPAFGILSEVVATFSRKRLFAYSSMVFATILIAFLGFMVWVHHMFTGGMGPLVNSIFAITSMMIAVPTGIKIFNWLFTMWGGQIRFTTAMLYAVGFIPTFVMGGVTGVMLAVAPADLQYHDTYFVVAHFHYVLIGGTLFGILAATYYWYPKIFGQMLDERLGKWSFWFVFIGFHMTFLIQHFLGLMGMPRRVFTYQEGFGFTLFNQISTIGTILLTIGVIIMLYNIVITAVRSKGKTVPADPWDGRTLEWAVSSPAPAYNFAQTPLVRGLDALWVEKEAGNKKMSPAEPLGPIHMPSNTFSAFLLSVAFFITGMGLIYRSLPITVVGVASIASCIVWFLLWEDKGYHIHPDEEPAEEGGA